MYANIGNWDVILALCPQTIFISLIPITGLRTRETENVNARHYLACDSNLIFINIYKVFGGYRYTVTTDMRIITPVKGLHLTSS